jgi:hypothetical protein
MPRWYQVDRFKYGRLMAEGAKVTAGSEAEAIDKAKRLFYPLAAGETFEVTDREPERIPCEMCENGQWWTECCNGADGCDCHGQPVCMGTCHVCGGSGSRDLNANLRANLETIQGRCFIGSGPTRGYWAGK